MIDNMNELEQFSPFAGALHPVTVPGDTSGKVEAENDADAGAGTERTMYAYAPKSGCPHPKQCQVLMVLRDESCECSAQALMEELGLDRLAEEKHFLLLFPNPAEGGWNYAEDPARENDMDYLVRCFAVLRQSELKVNGFNGMIFYVCTTPGSSALLNTMAARRPINVPAMMISSFPDGYAAPADAMNIPTAVWVAENVTAAEEWKRVDHVGDAFPVAEGVAEYRSRENDNIRLIASNRPIDKDILGIAWDVLFSETRRWQNDTHGTYQRRTSFTRRGFIPHVNDPSLGDNDGFPHTWYEYVPPQLRGTTDKVPLLFYFHGGGCVPLYGAEQSGWHDIADQEGFIVVYPEASAKATWNVWNDPAKPSDEDFFLALVEHMKKTYPIDETRIYVSGFSMGSMMSHAMASAHPELIAAANPCNAYHTGYFASYEELKRRMTHNGNLVSTVWDNEDKIPNAIRLEADAKKAAYDYRMPIFQVSGLLDQTWPVDSRQDERVDTMDYWKSYNHIPVSDFVPDQETASGFPADESFYDGEDRRFFRQRWHSADSAGVSLLELFLAKRMPHAVDLRTFRCSWAFMKRFSRQSDGSLTYEADTRNQ